jgi:hypothetical protein
MLFTLAARVDKLRHGLLSARAQALLLVSAAVLGSSSIGPYRALDDFVLGLIAQGRGAALGLTRDRFDLFTFTTGDVANNRRLMDVGLMLPWWTDEELRVAFFRPISSFTHFIDERLWPAHPALMHAQSLLWFLAMLAAVLLVYRRLEQAAGVSGLAFALYALDDAHAPALAWLANRNALIATCLGCLTIALHDRWRTRPSVGAGLLATLSFAAALLAGEGAVGALGYLLAYAIFLERGSKASQRVISVAPYLFVLVSWRLAWTRGGYGVHGSGAYIDPLANPFAFLAALPAKLGALVQGQFSVIPSDLAFLAPPRHVPLLVALSALSVVVVVYLFAPLIRKDDKCRFWALGMLLAMLPPAATFPSDRTLLFAGIGAMALVARLLVEFVARAREKRAIGGVRSLLALSMLLVHGVLAPLLLPLRAAQMQLFGATHDRAAAGIPSERQSPDSVVVVVTAPVLLFANYVQAERTLGNAARPAHLYVLSSASSTLEVRRSSATTLEIEPARGFLETPLDRHYRARSGAWIDGQRVALTGMAAEIKTREPDGRPRSVAFSFPLPIDRYHFVFWQNGRFVPFELPRLGTVVSLPEQNGARALLGI